MAWLISAALMKDYENSLSSPERAGESSEGISSDGEPSVPSSETPTPQAYLPADRMTDFSRLSRSGMTFAPLTANRGEDVLTWFLAGFPAKTFPQPGEVQASTGSGRDSGRKWPASLARYDHDSRSWRTHQYSLLGGLIEFSETWPRWGTMRGGECWAQSMPVRHTSGTGSGLLPTPKANDAEKRGDFDVENPRNGLPAAAKMWPTPAASDSKQRHTTKSTQRRLEIGKQISLEAAVGIQMSRQMWPTPDASAGARGAQNPNRINPNRQFHINDAVRIASTGGPETRQTTHAQLNPAWVEWLMGWPIGWTDLGPLATDRYRQWLHSHGGC